jgi:biotin carboxyl carrier protein
VATEEVKSEITGKVWKIESEIGARLEEEGTIMIIESMKMEIPVMAQVAGTLKEINVKEGDDVSEGQVVAVLEI